MKRNYIAIGVYCVACWPLLLVAQNNADSNNDAALQKTSALFYSTLGENAALYNGSEYIMYDQHIKGTPYFMDGQQPGEVFYNGTLYTKIPLIYEITTDNVVIREYDEGVFIDLVNEKINYFTLLNHTFVHLVPDSADKVISDGFYDRIYNGSTAVYVKRRKTIFEDPHTFEKSFVENDRYYIYKNNIFYPVNGRGSVLGVFKEKKRDLMKFIKQNDIDYKKDPEDAMVKTAEYYDTLTH